MSSSGAPADRPTLSLCSRDAAHDLYETFTRPSQHNSRAAAANRRDQMTELIAKSMRWMQELYRRALPCEESVLLPVLNFGRDDESASSHEPVPKRTRMNRRPLSLPEMDKLGSSYAKARADASGRNEKRWALKWAKTTAPEMAEDPRGLQNVIRAGRRAAARQEATRCRVGRAARGSGREGLCSVQVRPSHRKRRFGGGRQRKMPAVAEELFTWMIDTIDQIKGRMPASLLLQQAGLIVQDLKRHHQIEIENGCIEPTAKLDVPVLNASWLRSWRHFYGITYRKVNLRFKCSKTILMKRLAVFWENCIIVRALHAALEPHVKLVVEGFDQKPLWFTACGEEKTLHLRGREKVCVKENMPMSRARFSAMTRCRWPTPPEDGKELGILFKAASGATLRKRLRVPEGVLLQFQVKGSYRLQDVSDYLEWIIDRSRIADHGDMPASSQAPASNHRVLYLLDWFRPHLDPSLDDLVHDHGHAILRIGGHLTGLVQVEDTHAHGPYTKAYKKRETEDAHAQLVFNPRKMPSTSKQTVMDRAIDSWHEVDHTSCSAGFVSNGICNALDGSEDDLLSRHVAGFWAQLDMPTRRARILETIRGKVESGELTRFEDYTKLLVAYDAHEGLPEGAEAIGTKADDDDGWSVATDAETEDEIEDGGGGEDDGNGGGGPHAGGGGCEPGGSSGGGKSGDSGHSPDAPGGGGFEPGGGPGGDKGGKGGDGGHSPNACGGGFEPSGGPGDGDGGDGPGGGEPGDGKGGPLAGPAPAAKDPFEPKAAASLASELQVKMNAVNAAIEAIRDTGGDDVTEAHLERRLQNLMRKRELNNDKGRLFARARAIERTEAVAVKRRRTEAEDREKARLELQLKIQQAAAAEAKHKGEEEKRKANAELVKAKDERDAQKAREKQEAAEQDRRRLHFAAYLARRLWNHMIDPLKREERKIRLCRRTAQLAKEKKGLKCLPVPAFWPNVKEGLVNLTARTRLKNKQEPLYASPAFDFMLRRLQPSLSLDDPRFRFSKFMEVVMPEYHNLLGHRYNLDTLFAEARGVLDAAFLGAVYRYSTVCGEEYYRKGLHAWPPPETWGDQDTPNAHAFQASSSGEIKLSKASSSAGG